MQEPGSSVSIVSDYGLNDRAIGVRSPTEADDFSSNVCVKTSSGAHPASCPMGTGGPFSGGKERPGRDADYSSHLVPRSRMSRSYNFSPPYASIGVLWDCFFAFRMFCSIGRFGCVAIILLLVCVQSLNSVQIKFLLFMQRPCCYFTLYKELIPGSSVFSDSLQSYIVVMSHDKWR
jgi:hypothetical protein